MAGYTATLTHRRPVGWWPGPWRRASTISIRPHGMATVGPNRRLARWAHTVYIYIVCGMKLYHLFRGLGKEVCRGVRASPPLFFLRDRIFISYLKSIKEEIKTIRTFCKISFKRHTPDNLFLRPCFSCRESICFVRVNVSN